MHHILERFKRRKLVQWALAYLAVAWVLYEALQGIGEPWGVTSATLRALQVILGGGFVLTLVLAWYHGERGRQTITAPELIIITLLLGIVGLLTGRALQDGPSDASPLNPPGTALRFDVTPDDGSMAWDVHTGVGLSLSPDGRRMVYVGAGPAGSWQLWLRNFDELSGAPIPSTRVADAPVLSPDGEHVAFWSSGGIAMVSLLSGERTVIVAGGAEPYLDWGPDGVIYFTAEDGALTSVPAQGGDATTLAAPPDDGELIHPHALPEDRGILVTVRSSSGEPEIGLVELGSDEVRLLSVSGQNPLYIDSGHLLFATGDNTVAALPFDLEGLQAIGPAVRVLRDVATTSVSDITAQFATSESGALVYRVTSVGDRYRLSWVDRDGRARNVDPEADPFVAHATFSSPALSPGDDRLAIAMRDPDGQWDVWIKSLLNGTSSRFTLGGARRPAWSSDGVWLAYVSADGRAYRKRSDGRGESEPIVLARDPPAERSRVGEIGFAGAADWIVYRVGLLPGGSPDILAQPWGEEGDPREVAAGDFVEWEPAISPNGSWIAYTSNETGRYEVYVAPFPEADAGRWTVSVSGGSEPVWAHSGEEIFYVAPSGELMAAEIRYGPSFTVVGRTTLFSTRPSGRGGINGRYLVGSGGGHPMYDVSEDDQRFLMLQAVDVGVQQVVLIMGFREELKRLVPG